MPLLAFAGGALGALGGMGGCGYPDIEGTATTTKHFESADDDDGTTADSANTDTGDDTSTTTTKTTGSATDPFSNADAFASALPQLRATTSHTSGGAGVVPDYKQQCLSCHTGTTGPKFGFAGSIYRDAALTTPGKSVQIGLIDATGAAVITTADADGNFWMENAPAIKFPAYVAARDESGKKLMATKVTGADMLDCNSCHGQSNPLIK